MSNQTESDTTEDTVWLAGKPVSQQSLEDAQRVLTGMADLSGDDLPDEPSWLIAARYAVRDALEDD